MDEYLLKPVKKVQIAKALQRIEDKWAGELVIETALSVENIDVYKRQHCIVLE